MDRVSILLLGTERLPACSWATHEAADRAPDMADAARKPHLRGGGQRCHVTRRRVRELQGGRLIRAKPALTT